MLHLDAERLAELAETEPTSVEAAHLSVCEACCREREAYRRLLALAAADRDRLAPPITSWESLAADLRDEGLLEPSKSVVESVPGAYLTPAREFRRRSRVHWWMRVAAAAVLVASGVVGGRLSVPHQRAPVAVSRKTIERQPAQPGLTPASREFKPIANRQEALSLLSQAQFDYQRAAAFLAQNDTIVESPNVYRARLAAFDQSAAMFEEALAAQPADPVINAYYRATLQSRDVTLRQLGNAVQLVRY
jgi:hypothetical protein